MPTSDEEWDDPEMNESAQGSGVSALAGIIVFATLLYFLYVGAYQSAATAVLCLTALALLSRALSHAEVNDGR